MTTSPAALRSVRFADFEVDLRAGELRKHSRRIRLQEQPFQILAMLLERPGDVVTREELRQKLWPGDTFVDFDHGLNNAINRLREALNDAADSPRFIETLPRRGYRFIAGVEAVRQESRAAAAKTVEVAEAVLTHGKGTRTARQTWRWAAGAALLGLTLLFVLSPAEWRQRLWSGSPSAHVRSIVVLPLENLSGDPSQEYFAEGITDQLTTYLARIGSLRVISRTSAMQYQGKRPPLSRIARELKVDAVVEGSVVRSGNSVRITAQLIDANNDEHLWAESYDRPFRDILPLENEIARAIADEVKVKMTPQERQRLSSSKLINPEAYDAYLKGRYFWNRRTPEGIRKGLEYFQRALAAQPDYSLAFAGIADSYTVGGGSYLGLSEQEAFAKAEPAAQKAVELDDGSAEAHAAWAGILLEHHWDFIGAEREYRRALALSPGYATAHQGYAELLSAMGRHEEAIAEGRRAAELDPLSLAVNWSYGARLYFARRYQPAVAQLQHAMEIDPNFPRVHIWLSLTYEAMGKQEEAFAEDQRARELWSISPERLVELRKAYESGGLHGHFREILRFQKRLAQHSRVDPGFLAELSVRSGENEQAIEYLQQAYQQHLGELTYINQKPLFDPLRSDPRFQALVRRVGFASHPQSSGPSH